MGARFVSPGGVGRKVLHFGPHLVRHFGQTPRQCVEHHPGAAQQHHYRVSKPSQGLHDKARSSILLASPPSAGQATVLKL